MKKPVIDYDMIIMIDYGITELVLLSNNSPHHHAAAHYSFVINYILWFPCMHFVWHTKWKFRKLLILAIRVHIIIYIQRIYMIVSRLIISICAYINSR
jgi:hypothetical protein